MFRRFLEQHYSKHTKLHTLKIFSREYAPETPYQVRDNGNAICNSHTVANPGGAGRGPAPPP